MKRVICVNPKNYNLTNGREYTTRQSDDNAEVYEVVNDRGLVRNYNANLFEDVVREPITREATNQEILDSLDLLSHDEYYIRISFVNSFTTSFNDNGSEETINNITEVRWCPEYASTSISCGIREIYDLDDLITKIKNLNVDEEVQKRIFKFFIEAATDIEEKCDDDCALYILSTTNSSIGHLRDVLDDLSCNSVEVNNPNSGNDIIMWIIKV